MPHFAVLLRGVNVGKGNRVPMAELRDLLAELGYTEVRTLLNSGNAVVTSSDPSPYQHSKAIAAALLARLELSVPVIVKTAKDFGEIMSSAPPPPPEDEHSRYFIAYVQDPGSLRDLAPISKLVAPPERFNIGQLAAYMYCPAGALESKAGSALLGKAGRAATTRNWSTSLKLAKLLGESAG